MRCPTCGVPCAAEDQACKWCKEPILHCPGCGAARKADGAPCPACGAAQETDEEPGDDATLTLDAETIETLKRSTSEQAAEPAADRPGRPAGTPVTAPMAIPDQALRCPDCGAPLAGDGVCPVCTPDAEAEISTGRVRLPPPPTPRPPDVRCPRCGAPGVSDPATCRRCAPTGRQATLPPADAPAPPAATPAPAAPPPAPPPPAPTERRPAAKQGAQRGRSVATPAPRRSVAPWALLATAVALVVLALGGVAAWRLARSPAFARLPFLPRPTATAQTTAVVPVGRPDASPPPGPTSAEQPPPTAPPPTTATRVPPPATEAVATTVPVVVETSPPATAPAPSPTPKPPPPGPGLVGWWRFDEGRGSRATDSSGLGHDAVVRGARWVGRGSGSALALDGSGGFLELPSAPDLDALQGGDYTISVLFAPRTLPAARPQGEPEQYAVVVKRGWHEGLTYTQEGRFSLQHWLEGNVFQGAFSSSTFAPGTTYHLVGVVDRSAGWIRLYVNGRLEASRQWPAGSAARAFGSTPWTVGIADPASTEWRWAADGVVDELALFQRALDASQVARIAATPW